MATHDHLSDAALVARVARGQRAAVDALFSRFGHLAFGLAVEILQDEEAAGQVVSEAFASLRRPARGTDVRAQLLTDVHQLCVERVRSVPDREAWAAQPVRAPQTGWVELEAQAARDVLGSLDDEEREAIELAYYGCYTRHEIAALLAVSVDQVTERIASGMRRLGSLQALPREEAIRHGRPARPPG